MTNIGHTNIPDDRDWSGHVPGYDEERAAPRQRVIPEPSNAFNDALSNKGLWSLILGIAGLVLLFLVPGGAGIISLGASIAAVILAKKATKGKVAVLESVQAQAKWGKITGWVGIGLSLAAVVLILLAIFGFFGIAFLAALAA